MSRLDRASWLMLRRQARRRSAVPSLLVLGADAALVSFALVLADRGGLLAAGCSVMLLALVLLHLYLLHHECVHLAVFARRGPNVLLGHVLGFVLLYPFLQRQRSHLQHHAWAGNLTHDPANARARTRLARLSPRALLVLDVLWRGWVPFLALNERIGLWQTPSGAGDGPARRERLVSYAYLLGYAGVLTLLVQQGLLLAALRLWAPAFWLALVCEELVNLPHHLHAPTVSERLAPWEHGHVTHSCAPLPGWSRLVVLHFNLHTAHHLFPELGWYQLSDVQRSLVAMKKVEIIEHELSWSRAQRNRAFDEVFAVYLSRPAAQPDL